VQNKTVVRIVFVFSGDASRRPGELPTANATQLIAISASSDNEML
jgi:hypothetical protein